MLLTNLRTAARILRKNRGINLLNIIGLSLGFSVSILLGAYSVREYSYDLFNPNADRTYQLWASLQLGPAESQTSRFSPGTAEEINDTYPGVELFTRICRFGQTTIGVNNTDKFFGSDVVFSDSSVFDVFGFSVVTGSAQSLSRPNSVFLSHSLSKKLFGEENPINRTVVYADTLTLRVDGVFSDLPSLSSIQFDAVISLPTLERAPLHRQEFARETLGLGSFQTFFRLKDEQAALRIEQMLPKVKEPFALTGYHLEPMSGAHVRNYGGEEKSNAGIFGLIAIGLFIVVVANSLSVTVSQNIDRSNEIVVRKIIGASWSALLSLFYAEAFLISLLSFGVSFAVALSAMHFSNSFLGIELEHNFLIQAPFIYYVLSAFVITVAIGGSYPAFVLSSRATVLHQRSPFQHSKFATGARRLSMTFQLVASIMLILGALVVGEQFSYMRSLDVGMNVKDVLVLSLDPADASKYQVLRQQLTTVPEIDAVGASSVSLFDQEPPIVMASRADSTNMVPLAMMIADSNFFPALKIESASSTGRTDGVILNEVAKLSFQLGDDATNYQIRLGDQELPISGLVGDFNYASLHNQIGNLAVTLADDSTKVFAYTGCYVFVRMRTADSREATIRKIEEVVKQTFPDRIFTYSFLEDKLWSGFETERAMLQFVRFFTFIAILIACFGLVGSFLHNVKSRMGELTIRRVLGADLKHLSYTISKEVIIVLFLSLILGVAIDAVLLIKWLDNFVYRTQFGLAPVLFCMMLSLLLVFSIALFFILKISRANLIKYLRKE